MTGVQTCALPISLYQKKEDCSWEFKLEFGSEDINTLSWDLNPRKEMDLNTVMHGIRTTGVSISPNGKYAKYSYKETVAPEGNTSYWSEVIDLKNNSTILSTKHNNLGSIYFHPTQNAIYYRKNNNGKSQVYMQSLENGEITFVMETAKEMNHYSFSNDGNVIIYGINIILNNVESNIEKTFSDQIKSIKFLEKYINNWNNYFSSKDFDGMA
mgnify:CR=1 FL=1